MDLNVGTNSSSIGGLEDEGDEEDDPCGPKKRERSFAAKELARTLSCPVVGFAIEKGFDCTEVGYMSTISLPAFLRLRGRYEIPSTIDILR